MGAANLMTTLRDAGFELEAADGGGVRVWPADALTNEIRAVISNNKGALIEQLAREAASEAFEERAGIREFDGGQHRLDAERGAAADLGIREACLACRHRSARRTCLEPVAAGLTDRFEIVWCELLPESPCAAFEAKAPLDTNYPGGGVPARVASKDARRIDAQGDKHASHRR